jgi:ubiquinone/menaquinone biosynthesis C-methylase UbiE
MMADVACFCGCCFSFDSGAAACPRCGEVASVTSGLAPGDAGRSQPTIPVPVVNGIGHNRQTPEACPERADAGASSRRPAGAIHDRDEPAGRPPFPELTREHSHMQRAMTSTAQPSATDVYALGRDPGESERLQRQSEELGPDSAALLDRVGLRPGQDAIDLGCGPRGILDLLAERVAPGGRVTGLDADPGHVAMARKFTARRGLRSVQIVAADARRTGLPPGSFDLVHARTLLVNLPGPAEVVAEMVRLARPGGWVASLEPDVEGALCYPAHPAYTRMWELFRAAFGRHGADLLIGRRLAELYRQAGLYDIGIEARARVCQPGDSRRTIGPDLVRSLHPMIVSLGLADQGELDALDRAVRSHLDDPRTLVMPHLSFLAWGRKPQAQP